MAMHGGEELVQAIAAEIAQMHYAGQVKAIACVIVDADGDLRTLSAFCEGKKLPLVAGVSILQHSLLAGLEPTEKARDL